MNPVLVAVVAVTVVLAVAFAIVLLVGGTVGTRIAKRRDRREYLLDDAQDFDDEPEERCCIHPSNPAATCNLGYNDPDPNAVIPAKGLNALWSEVDAARTGADPNDEVTNPWAGEVNCGGTPEFPQLRELEIAELNRPATDEEYYAGDGERFIPQQREATS